MNKFEILGRVNWIEIKYSEKGSCFTKILLAKKLPKKDEYESFPITFFNTRNGDTAERLAETVKEGDYIRVTGKLGINRYIPKGQTRVKEDVELIGWGFQKVKWDSEQNKYVDVVEE